MDLQPSISESILLPERSRVQERLDGYTSPVLTLPNEITSEIFLRFLPDYPATPPLTGLASPITLTHVCRQWRAVALATPVLWRAIEFHTGRTPHTQIRRISDEWMRRASSCPLSININTPDGDFIHEILAEHSAERWEHLQLYIPLLALPAIGGRPLPTLRGLEIFLTAHRRARFSVPDVVFLDRDVPQLRTVVLHGPVILLGPVIPKVTLPWAQVTRLTLKYAGVEHCIRILRQAPNLIECILVLHDTLPYVHLPSKVGTLVLPFLEVLGLSSLWDTAVGFLHAFIVPSLKRLELEENCLGPEPLLALEAFIAKSGCSLQEVEFLGETEIQSNCYRRAFPFIPIFCFAVPDAAMEDESQGV
ncbi:hypothetical protein C8R45DRAFT_578737 [Mycena sanguinolenta]|nr:hypothetical protein C8R45DRAFT_578737 [Mycena sanguinolenta]